MLKFRSLNVDATAPVEAWPFEGVLAALERGGRSDWHRIAAAIRVDPFGEVAQAVEEALPLVDSYGMSALMTEVLRRARGELEAAERNAVAEEVRSLVRRAGMTGRAFAAAMGTSASRRSTYMNGKVVPSATLMHRMRRLSERRGPA